MRPKVPLQFLIEKACEEKNCFPRKDFEKSVLKNAIETLNFYRLTDVVSVKGIHWNGRVHD